MKTDTRRSNFKKYTFLTKLTRFRNRIFFEELDVNVMTPDEVMMAAHAARSLGDRELACSLYDFHDEGHPTMSTEDVTALVSSFNGF